MTRSKLLRINRLDRPYAISYLIVLALATLAVCFLTSCEDPMQSEYKPVNFVDGFLIVGQPIKDIKLMLSQPVDHAYDLEKSLIRDAQVTITGDGQVFHLVINTTGDSGYYCTDQSYLVKEATTYNLEIKLAGGTIMTSQTTTPARFEWSNRVQKQIQYPTDTVNLPGTQSISWASPDVQDYYYIMYVPLDTLNYGKYLTPQTNEPNRRVFKTHEDDTWKNETAFGHLVGNTESSIVWAIFRWYGPYQITVYKPDGNMMKAGMQNNMFYQYDPLLCSINGGCGFFGSASVVRDTTFLIKNQP